MRKTGFIICLILFQSLNVLAQKSVLQTKINQIINSKRATVGVGILDFENGDTLMVNGKEHFPMQSFLNFIWLWQF